jgi:hypothetical protein
MIESWFKQRWMWLVTILGLMFLHPVTRRIVLFILPLGSGKDDLLELILIGIAVLYWGRRWYIKWDKTKAFRDNDRHPNTKVKQSAWVILALIVTSLLPGMKDHIYNAFLYGRGFAPEMLFAFGISLIVVMIGWNVISYFDRGKRSETKE